MILLYVHYCLSEAKTLPSLWNFNKNGITQRQVDESLTNVHGEKNTKNWCALYQFIVCLFLIKDCQIRLADERLDIFKNLQIKE